MDVNTNNKIINLNMQAILFNNINLVFGAMHSVASESIVLKNNDSEMIKGYMKLLSDNNKNK